MDLGDDASIFFAEDALNRLEPPFSWDDRLIGLCAQVRLHIGDDIGSEVRTRHLPSLREYLSETYKLHRRLLRTRRADPQVSDYLPRRTGVAVIPGTDEARDEASDFLDAWRLAILDAVLTDRSIAELGRVRK